MHAESPQDMAPAVFIDIARCESTYRQYDATGRVLESKTHDLGLYQINRRWIPVAKKLGYDIMTPEGNTAFALYLYRQHGTRDWNSSKGCWQPSSDG